MDKDKDEFYCGGTEPTEEYDMKDYNREAELLDALRIIRDDLDEIIRYIDAVGRVTNAEGRLRKAIQTLHKVRNFANDASLWGNLDGKDN